MKSTTVYLSDDQHEVLKKISRDTGVPMAAMVRKGIDLAIAYFETRAEALEIGLRSLEEEASVTPHPSRGRRV